MKCIATIFLLISSLLIFAQEEGLSEDIAAVVILDSFVVSASQQGFQVADFIDIVQADESFFLAFHQLRLQDHYAKNTISIFNKKGKEQANYKSYIHQKVVGKCRTMDVLEEEFSKNFFKNEEERKHRYYTARMHHSIFYTNGKICETRDRPNISEEKLSGIQKNINELKKLIFQPGREVDVPFIGNKTAIFKKDMIRYYNFFIKQVDYVDGTPAYVFTASVKPNYQPGKTIIKYLETWFDKSSFQVLGRNYHLQYDGIVDFDVKMKVVLQQLSGQYIPSLIEYDGAWKVPLQKREIARFRMEMSEERQLLK